MCTELSLVHISGEGRFLILGVERGAPSSCTVSRITSTDLPVLSNHDRAIGSMRKSGYSAGLRAPA